MQFEIKEVQEVPRRHVENVRSSKYLPIIEAAIASETGIVSADFKGIKECQHAGRALHDYLKRHGIADLFRLQQRRGVLFVTDLSRAGTDRDPARAGR